jgi:P-type E1-E2 ATPase
VDAAHDRLKADGKAVSYVAVDGALAGAFIFEDRIRPEAPALITRLKSLGISEIWMLTGDADENARAISAGLGIEHFRSRMLPDQKVEVVHNLMKRQPVMMVGDGINDAPALAAATVGVAMGHHGAGIATDAADVVVTVENVERVADAIALGRRMLVVARQGILFGMGVSTVLMGIAAFGWIQPALGALLQEALDLATILNAFRARHV